MTTVDGSGRPMGRVSPRTHLDGQAELPSSSYILTKAHILDAIARSTDNGCTLDLSNRNLTDVGETGAEELAQVGRDGDLVDECRILRIALVGNCLHSLPKAFAHLSRLRYLTLRSNSFTEFPEVLTTMPSLEILDFSRNRIRRLPSNPGTLVNLKVISISRNKIRKLPSYLTQFKNLSVLKADHNPITWPPKDVMEPDVDWENPSAMLRWVDGLKEWLSRNPSDEENEPLESDTVKNGKQFDAGVTPHARSFSVDSESSTYSTSSYANSMEDNKSDNSPTAYSDSISPIGPDVTPSGTESYLPTPDSSLTAVDTDDDTARSLYGPQHGRNKSYAHEKRMTNRNLSSQKSLPDLRTAKTGYASREKHLSPLPENTPSVNESSSQQPQAGPSNVSFSGSLTSRIRRSRVSRQPHSSTSPVSESGARSMDFERNSYFRRLSTLPASTISRTTPQTLLSVVDSVRGILFAVSQIYQNLQHYTVYAIDERLSSVLLKVLDPASSCMMELITALDDFDSSSRNGCPSRHACRRVVESCRDNVEMFGKAVSVLALQLKVLASHDDVRYTRQMLLVLYGAMAEIGNAWQRMAPLLGSVEPLLRVDKTASPVKQAIPVTPLSISKLGTIPHKAHFHSKASLNRVTIPPIAEQPEPSSMSAPAVPVPSLPRSVPSLARAHSAQPSVSTTRTGPPLSRPTTSEGRSRMTRRHAGSFSVKDVEIGRSMPSSHELSPPSGGIASGHSTPTPRAHQTLARSTPSLSSSTPHLPSLTTPAHTPIPSRPIHSRQNSGQNGSATPPVPVAGPSRVNLEPAPSSAIPADKEGIDSLAIDAMVGAVQVAPSVWSMLEEIFNEMHDAPPELRDGLRKAQDVTTRLAENIKAIQEGLPSADRKALREDAHVFIKTVVSLSNIVKEYGTAHQLSAQLRRDIGKLTNATQEFVMLLHVSSFSPSSTPRPYSPMPNGNVPVINGQSAALSTLVGEDKLLHPGGANLSRSRSAQPSASSKLASVAANAVPRSALPNQTFKIPTLAPRMASGLRLRSTDIDNDNHG